MPASPAAPAAPAAPARPAGAEVGPGLHAVALVGGAWWGGGPRSQPAGPCAAPAVAIQVAVGGCSPSSGGGGCPRAASLRALLPELCLPGGGQLRPALSPRASLARVAGCHSFLLRAGAEGAPPLYGACLQYWEPVSLGLEVGFSGGASGGGSGPSFARGKADAEALFCLVLVSETAFFGAHFISLHNALTFDLSERRSAAGAGRRRTLEEGLAPSTLRALGGYLHELGLRGGGGAGGVPALRLARESTAGRGDRPGAQALALGNQVLRELSSMTVESSSGGGGGSGGGGTGSGFTLRLETSARGGATKGESRAAEPPASPPASPRALPPALLPALEASPARGRLAAPFHALTWASDKLSWAVAAAAEALPLDALLAGLSAALTERPVLVTGDSLYGVTSVTLGLAELLKPFTFQGTLMPLVPPSLLTLLDSPTPLLAGVLREDLAAASPPARGALVLDLALGASAPPGWRGELGGAPYAIPVPALPGEARLSLDLQPVHARLREAMASSPRAGAALTTPLPRFPGHLPVEAACAALELSVLVEDHLRTFAERVARHSLRDTDSGLCVLLQEPLFAAFEAGDLLFLDDFLGAQICVEHFELTRL